MLARKKIYSCQNNSEKSYTEEKTKHAPSGYSFFTNYLFDSAENNLDCYRGKDCMGRFCKGLREHAMKTIDYERKGMIPRTEKESKSYKKQKVCYICKQEFSTNKLYHKVRDHCHYTRKYRGGAHSIYHLRYQKKFQ